MDRISVNGKRFVDEYGRTRIFSGINFGCKNILLSDYEALPNVELTIKQMLVNIRSKGINIIRLMMNWSLLEPKPNCYNQKAFDDIANVLDIAKELDMYVILDMHQDLYSTFQKKPSKRVFGDGAPYWACDTNGARHRQPRIIWASGYFFGKSVQNAFDNFWDNKVVEGRGLQEHFCALWARLAGEFGNHDAVIGFDMLNEPFCDTNGMIFKSIAKGAIKMTLHSDEISKRRLLSSLFKKAPVSHLLEQYTPEVVHSITASSHEAVRKFDIGRYADFLNRTSSAIREVNDDKILFFEHSYYSNTGIPFSFRGITRNGEKEKNQAFAPHAYDLMVDTPMYKYADNGRVKAIFDQRYSEQQEMDLPVLVGEWGGGGLDTKWLHHADFLLDLFEKRQWSYCYWCYFTQIPEKTLDTLCRAHPVAVAGEIISYHYDRKDNSFSISYNAEKCEKPTEIFLPSKPKSVSVNTQCEIEDCFGAYKALITAEDGRIDVKFTF